MSNNITDIDKKITLALETDYICPDCKEYEAKIKTLESRIVELERFCKKSMKTIDHHHWAHDEIEGYESIKMFFDVLFNTLGEKK